MNKVTVVKVGGALLENPAAATERIAAFAMGRTVVVHGGGVQITRMLEQMKVKSRFIDGLRVTDEVTLSAAAAALLGHVQTALVQALQTAGVPAVGIFGAVKAVKKIGPWGLVGENVTADRRVLQPILESGLVPVVPTLALGASLLNVNGDETAAAVALALKADRLIFLTDVEGVLDADGKLIERVPPQVSLLDAPFVTGGMKPKLRAVAAALNGGVAGVFVGRTAFGEPG